ncbi:MAG: hypothetical protein S4CHLAM123_10290 [Chlamydiales bacterium]|nr:hypothetical protein [Chlamydiales bacterium]
MTFHGIKRSTERKIFGSGTKGAHYYEKSRWNGRTVVKEETLILKKINKFGLRKKINQKFDEFKNLFS